MSTFWVPGISLCFPKPHPRGKPRFGVCAVGVERRSFATKDFYDPEVHKVRVRRSSLRKPLVELLFFGEKLAFVDIF